MTQAELLPALQFTPPVISLNFEELEANIEAITEQYKGVIVQEDDVPAIKNEMAGLNKLAGNLAEARKGAAVKISEPIREFESKVKILEAKVLDTRTFLDDQVKAHIQRERDGKRASVQFIIDSQKDEHGCKGLDIPIQESWLNKTAKDKAITAEVQSIILANKRQQEERAALEQAKKDRVVALEGHCKALEQGRGYSLPFSRFAHLQGLDMPLADAMAKIGQIYADEDARIAEIGQRKIAPPQPQPKAEPHFLDMPQTVEHPQVEAKPLRKSMTITATYNAENGQAIQALYRQIKTLCLTCTAQVQEI